MMVYVTTLMGAIIAVVRQDGQDITVKQVIVAAFIRTIATSILVAEGYILFPLGSMCPSWLF